MSTRKTKINKIKQKTKTVKNTNSPILPKSDSGTSINYYNLRYSGTKLLPRTSILIYIYKNHFDYIKLMINYQ